jgi:hypothetical protein
MTRFPIWQPSRMGQLKTTPNPLPQGRQQAVLIGAATEALGGLNATC